MYTVKELGKKLGEPPWRCYYVAVNKLDLEPAAKAGPVLLFDETQLEKIKAGLQSVQIRAPRPVRW